jgi:hypothetical protein
VGCLRKLGLLLVVCGFMVGVMCAVYFFVLTVLMCYSIGSGVGWGTLALLSQSDLDWLEQVM